MSNDNSDGQTRGPLNLNFESLYHVYDNENEDNDSPLNLTNLNCKYYEPTVFCKLFEKNHKRPFFLSYQLSWLVIKLEQFLRSSHEHAGQ